MTKRTGKRIRRRHLVIVFLLFAGMGALIVLAHLRPPVNLPVEESSEMIAKRLDKDNNAFYVLESALALMPEPPPALELKDEDKWPYKYEPTDDSIGLLLSVQRPDDDPLLLDYLDKSRPAMELALEALAKPYYLHPPLPFADQEAYLDFLRMRRKLMGLPSLFLAEAMRRPCSQDPNEDACEFLLNAWRVVKLMSSDELSSLYGEISGALRVIKQASPEHQQRIVQHLEQLRREWTPPVGAIEDDIRRTYGSTFRILAPPGNKEDLPVMMKVTVSIMLAQEKRMVLRFADDIRKAGCMTYVQYDQYLRDHPEFKTYRPGFVAPRMDRFVSQNSVFFGALDGLSIAVALEQFKRASGSYPDGLEALVPTYLPRLPSNPFDGTPYNYRRDGDDYVLNCVGGHRHTDTWRPRDIFEIYQPPHAEER